MTADISRRALLKAAGLSGAGLAFASIMGPSLALAQASARGFTESPMLAEKVAAGQLPPLDERLPEEVFKVGQGVLLQDEFQTWEDGAFGGELRVASVFPTPFTFLGGGGTILRSPGQTTEASLPNVVSAFSHSDDFTVFRFTIRKGLRWSDGEPVTTEDVRFHFEDIYGDPEVGRAWPAQLFTQGNSTMGPAKLKIIDEYNFELTFSAPYGFFIADLNSWIPNYELLFRPAHYFKQFHKKYADPAKLEEQLKANAIDSWSQLLKLKEPPHWEYGTAAALGMPVLLPWVLTEYSEQRTVFERNPYYWHVDGKGQQLPYIDRIVNNRAADRDAQVNATLAGQVDLAVETDAPLSKMSVYVQNAEAGGYRVFTTGSFNYPIQLFLNHDYEYDKPDSAWQKLVADPERRFGRAIGLAIDPQDINDSVFYGMFGEPFLTTKTFDPDEAETLLDAIGMSEKDGEGFRLGLDGQRFVLRLSFSEASSDFPPVAELLKEQLEAVGIRVEIDPLGIDFGLFNQRKAANEIQASLFWNDGTAWEGGISEDYLPSHKGPWSPMTWQYYTTQGKEGREPPAYIQEFYDIHTQRKAYPPESEQGKALFAKMMQWFDDNCVLFPVSGLKVVPNVVHGGLRNTQNEGAPYELDSYLSSEGLWFQT